MFSRYKKNKRLSLSLSLGRGIPRKVNNFTKLCGTELSSNFRNLNEGPNQSVFVTQMIDTQKTDENTYFKYHSSKPTWRWKHWTFWACIYFLFGATGLGGGCSSWCRFYQQLFGWKFQDATGFFLVACHLPATKWSGGWKLWTLQPHAWHSGSCRLRRMNQWSFVGII